MTEAQVIAEWRRETRKFMTLKMTERESVCVSVGEGEGRRGREREREGAHSFLLALEALPPPREPNLVEERGHGRGRGGCQTRDKGRQTDRW